MKDRRQETEDRRRLPAACLPVGRVGREDGRGETKDRIAPAV